MVFHLHIFSDDHDSHYDYACDDVDNIHDDADVVVVVDNNDDCFWYFIHC